jgi:Na+-transporting NADH:ubiquinone oxidoreductase subunit NqrF
VIVRLNRSLRLKKLKRFTKKKWKSFWLQNKENTGKEVLKDFKQVQLQNQKVLFHQILTKNLKNYQGNSGTKGAI